MDEIHPPLESTSQAGLLDALVIFAENIKLLVVGSLLVGLCALAISFALPRTFKSVAILQSVDATTAGLMVTAAVLDPVIETVGLAKNKSVEDAREMLRANQIKPVIGRTDKLLTLTVAAPSASEAQAIAYAVLKQTYLESKPKGNIRTRLEVQLNEAKARLKNAQEAAAGVLKRLEMNSLGLNGGAELSRGYGELLGVVGTAQGQISVLEAALDGVSPAQLLQAPTLAEKPSSPHKALIALGATLAAGLALLLFIFMRHAVRKTSLDKSTSEKLTRIRHALRFR